MRKLAWFILFFALAAGLSVYLLPAVGIWIGVCTSAVCLPLFLLMHGKTRIRWILSCAGAAAGLLYFVAYTAVFITPALSLSGQSASFTATILSYPTVYESEAALDVSVDLADSLPFTVQIWAEPDLLQSYTPGDRISVHGSLESAIEKGSYSYGRVLEAQADSIAYIGHEVPTLRGLGAIASHKVKTVINEIFPSSASSLAVAMVTGDKTLFNSEEGLSESFQIAGLSHIVAVSGLHLTYLLALPGLLVHNRRRYACLATPLIIFFMAFAGFTPSVCRAGIMCLLLALSGFFRRESDSLTTVSAALMLLLLEDPYAAASVSLQLSFGSVLGILLLSERIKNKLMQPFKHLAHKARRFPDYFISSFSVSLGALAATVPLSALYFGRVSIVAPLVSLLTFWMLTAAFLLTVGASLIGLLWLPAGAVAALPAALLLRLIIWIAKVFSGFQFAALYTDNSAVIVWIMALYLTCLILLLGKAPIRSWIIPGCVLTAALCGIMILPGLIPVSGLTVTALDVGQGQCIVFRSGTRTAVVDCGSSSGEDSSGILLSYLHSKGVSCIDVLMLTHYHSDHCNGIPEVLASIPVDAVILPPSDDEVTWDESIIDTAIEQGCSLYHMGSLPVTVNFGSASAVVYPSLAESGENERCLAIVCSSGSFDVLITGDMPDYCEVQLTEYADLPDTEVLIVGHHGSATSCCQALLDDIKPNIAVISVGENSYGHPTDEVLARLSAIGAAVFRTDTIGSITIASSPEA